MKNNDSIEVFIDTNIALHYKRLDQINWISIFGKIDIKLVVTSILLMELEKNKVENRSKKLRKRAGEYCSWLLKRYDDPILNDDVKIIFNPNEPLIDFEANGLDKQNYDDRLVASVLEHRERNPDKSVCVLTADSGVILKFRMRGVSVKPLPSEYILPEELDELESENKDLRAELIKLKNRSPRLKLAFQNGLSIIRVIPKTYRERSSIISERLYAIKNKYPKSEISKNNQELAYLKNFPALMDIGKTINNISENQRNTYDQQLDKFYDEFSDYLGVLYDFEMAKCARIEFDLMLSNIEGSGPANSIDVFINLPNEFNFISKNKLPDAPAVPKIPKKPKSIFDSGGFDFNTPLPNVKSLSDVLRENNPILPKVDIGKDGAKFCVHQLKHVQSVNLDRIWLDFGTVANFRNITVQYEIHAEEIDPVSGELHIVFER